MPILMLYCNNCGKIFSSRIDMGLGSSATFINNKSQCPYCGSMENIPDGTFRSTIEGFTKILEASDNPIEKAKELLSELKKIKTIDDINSIKKSAKFEKFKDWLPNSPEKILVYISIISVIINLLIKNPETHIEYNTFVNQYNQTIINKN